MKLSAPIHRLKHRAKLLARKQGLPLHTALDRIAVEEGFARWSQLAAGFPSPDLPVRLTVRAKALLTELNSGSLVLLGARPGHGKTLLGLALIAEALQSGRTGVFFTLAYSPLELGQRFEKLGKPMTTLGERFAYDDSDAINADYIIKRMDSAPPATVIVIDYLQLLDQKRENPPLMDQVSALKRFARERELIIVCISQIVRSFNSAAKACPDLDDVRLPNPLDLSLFGTACFLHDGKVQIQVSESGR